jgi:hypothetical protein
MWTIQQFKLVYDRFQSSGLSVKDFCENECILQSKFSEHIDSASGDVFDLFLSGLKSQNVHKTLPYGIYKT